MPLLISEPLSFTAGETVQWQKKLPNYLPKDGWQLVYSFCSTDNKFEVIAEAKENYYVIHLTSDDTVILPKNNRQEE